MELGWSIESGKWLTLAPGRAGARTLPAIVRMLRQVGFALPRDLDLRFSTPRLPHAIAIHIMPPADHFSQQSDAYKEFRPTYPAEVFDWLA